MNNATADSGMPGRHEPTSAIKGAITITDRAGIRIHSYVSPADGWHVNSHIVETPTRLIIFDGQFLNKYAEEVVAYTAALGKPVDRIILSHDHPDHWAGLEILTQHFPNAPIYALSGMVSAVRENGSKMISGLKLLLGQNIASKETIPGSVLEPGRVEIDGIVLEFHAVEAAESALQLLALLPEQRAALVFDLVFAPEDHLFTVAANFQHWISVLQMLKALDGYDILLVGHGPPVGFAAIDATILYLLRAAEIHAASVDGTGYATGLKTAFPDRRQAAWAEFSGRRLFPPVAI